MSDKALAALVIKAFGKIVHVGNRARLLALLAEMQAESVNA